MGQVVQFDSPSPGKAGKLVKRTLCCGGYEADFYADPKTTLIHFIITRKGDAEIVMWGQEPSMSEAERVALDWMGAFVNRQLVG